MANNTVAVIDTATNQIVGSIPVGALPWAVAINPAPNANLGYTANFGDDTVSVFRTDTNALVTTIPIGNPLQVDHGMSVAVHPAGTRVYAGLD